MQYPLTLVLPEYTYAPYADGSLVTMSIDSHQHVIKAPPLSRTHSTCKLVEQVKRLPKNAVDTLQSQWSMISTAPPMAQVERHALRSAQDKSWVPLQLLAYGTTARASLAVSGHLLARHLAQWPIKPPPKIMSPGASAALAPKLPIVGNLTINTFVITCAVVVVSLVFSVLSAVRFAQDTAKVCPQRARASFVLSIIGLVLATAGTCLGEFFHSLQADELAWPSVVPKALGLYCLFVRLPYSFTASELVHGNTPLRCRNQVATHLGPLAAALFVLRDGVREFAQAPEWCGEILLGTSLSLIVFAFALHRTDLSRQTVSTRVTPKASSLAPAESV